VTLLTAAILLSPTLGEAQEAAPHRLNNLVTEVLRLDSVAVSGDQTHVFRTPRAGWIHLGATLEAKPEGHVTVECDGMVVLSLSPEDPEGETMRNLPAGEHGITLRGDGVALLPSLSVRTMPETHFVRYPQEPRFPEQGNFNWAWLKANVLSSVNTLVGFPGDMDSAIIDEWTGSGRKLLSYGHLPKDEGLTAEMAFDFWHRDPGFQDPRLHGLIADEFKGRQDPKYAAWTEGMRRLGEAEKGTGQAFYAYCGGPGMYSRPETRALVNTVFDAGFYMAWERYHHEMPTEMESRAFMDQLLGQEMARWKKTFPGCEQQMVVVLGLFATGPDLDVRPDVNYKVWMDMQMQYLATHPAFDGLFGVHWWFSGYATEELLRWESALYRHYCIEGNTELLSNTYGWTYALDHIQNPDFFEETAGWELHAAAPDSLRAGYLERYAIVQGRYWQRASEPDEPAGNTFLWMKRQAEKPNRVSQEIKNLTPGKCYTLRAITADYQDITQGRSVEGDHALSLTIAGAEMLPEGSYTGKKVRGSSHAQLPFPDGTACFNHHQVMFRATAPSARLTISDWANSEEPGGPIGQELMVNYLQLEPYFEAGSGN
jgi:hypothetical protein